MAQRQPKTRYLLNKREIAMLNEMHAAFLEDCISGQPRRHAAFERLRTKIALAKV